MKKNKIHYAWIILILCCAIQAGTQGAIHDTKGVFTSPVCSELGFDIGDFSLALTFGALSMLIAQPFTSFFYKKFGMKKVLIVSAIIYYVTHYALAFGNHLITWYILMVIHEISSCFFYKTSYTILLCNWFVSKTAYALGIATAVGSISGMLLNPIYTGIITNLGWRAGYKISALIGTLLTLPAIILLFKESPKQENTEPYIDGTVEKKSEYFPCKFDEQKAPIISIMIIAASSVAYLCGGYYLHLPNYATSTKMDPSVGSLLTSAELAGIMAMKFILGPILDKIGIMKTELLMAALSIFGYTAYFFFGGVALLATTTLCGIFCATNTVLLPLFAREKIGEANFIKILPIMTTIGSAISSLSNTLYGYIFDNFGNYNLMFIICIAGILLSYTTIVIVNKQKEDM